MARKVGVSREQVVAAAVAIADRDGLAALTLTDVARELGIRAPSLYAHVDGLPGLLRALQAHGAHVLAEAIRDASDATDGVDAMRAFARVYRQFAREHPGLYEVIQQHAASPDDDPVLAAALGEPVAVVARALASLGIDGDDAVHTVRIWRAALHGFVDLERRGGFAIPLALDDTYARLVDSLLTPLTSVTPQG
ncbi:MAG TPA: TetR-like C-terminal domain-containing protein [Acidimicrobiia bacterium]|nr:TetR-like C-terminal domain-containing protein [Acidimicrobiia bacterium]